MAAVLERATQIKSNPVCYRELLRNETVVLYFAKPSTRTRISSETAVARLGGVPVTVSVSELQLGRGETIEDTAQVISRYARAFLIRTYDDDDVRRFAAAAAIPVVNALTDMHHPLQSLADMLTLQARFGADLSGLKLAYVGDGNNVAHSLIEAAALTGITIAVATPKGYEPAPAIVAEARTVAERTGASIELTHDPYEAVEQANALYTDVWLSMGTAEDERAERLRRFAGYQVDDRMMATARADAVFMHCLPDHRGEEVSASVVDGPLSVVFDQAENRLHTTQAVLVALILGELTER
jgi:ornithine carbamoyltransferase